jgi:hypothetical protein
VYAHCVFEVAVGLLRFNLDKLLKSALKTLCHTKSVGPSLFFTVLMQDRMEASGRVASDTGSDDDYLL